ncbi:hypothetical protein [Paenibacillus contaminans]|uniref:Uncharacterized protein n=1 Tax=Paenibacillus contaminans TaxID=450362 RepID=A0A329MKB2_9BACL|nr:hypothetical protein [Paenibacillus contaminans]RAV20289.1 hypothetical protein DQG23_15030 [Paenibacillus contaminans]
MQANSPAPRCVFIKHQVLQDGLAKATDCYGIRAPSWIEFEYLRVDKRWEAVLTSANWKTYSYFRLKGEKKAFNWKNYR